MCASSSNINSIVDITCYTIGSNAINDNGSGLFQSIEQIIPMFWCLIIAFGSTGIEHKQKKTNRLMEQEKEIPSFGVR